MSDNTGRINSHSIVYRDFDTSWYKNWAKKLKQTEKGRGKYALYANKFWQNAVMVQALYERGALEKGKTGIGFGVGKERLPALFAGMGVKIMATDQDFTQAKAKMWDNDQLAEGAFSLNEDGICKPDLFKLNVEFSTADMLKIPKKFHGKYDFLWSNCALGHLGSIDSGLGFIKNSLQCLKPGGWAAHTTEFNILSNSETVSTGDVVIFRAKDIYKLCVDLTKSGNICSPFHFSPGKTKEDIRVSLRPEEGNDFSKILVYGHIASQIILIVHKPAGQISTLKQKLEIAKHYRSYRKNLREIKNMPVENPTIRQLLGSQRADLSRYSITPAKKAITVLAKSKRIIVEYVNESALPLISVTGLQAVLINIKPIVLATHEPINRESKLYTKAWLSPNRPSAELYKRTNGSWQPVDYVEPGEPFGFVFEYSNPRMKTDHTESFIVVQEGGGIIPGSNVDVTINHE